MTPVIAYNLANQDPLGQLPEPASTFVSDVDGLFYFVTWVSLASFALIMALLVYSAIRFRRKTPDQPAPMKFTHNTSLEIIWTLIPTVVVMVIFAWGWKGNLDQSVVPADALRYRAVAQKWSWSFYHPNDTGSSPVLYVPVDTDVRISMTSNDVLHSFFVPAFRQKRDVVPGMRSLVWFRPTKIGVYDLFCTEYCGDGHSTMITKVHVVAPEEMEKKPWIPDTPEAVGKQKYMLCMACHSIDGSVAVGPSFKGLWGRKEKLADGTEVLVDEDYIRESIRYPMKKIVEGYGPDVGKVMVAFDETLLSDADIDAIIAYLKSDELK